MNETRHARPITGDELRQRLSAGEEWAFLDVREEGAFAGGHLLPAVCVPLSRLEMLMADLVPRAQTPVVVCGGSALAERGAGRLAALGYENVSVLPGDAADWRAAGFEVFTGIHVPSKAFGEFVEDACGTPHIAPAELKRRLDAGDDVLVLDSRPLDEYRTRCIPGAIDVPGVELVYRIKDLVRSPESIVVVNCGGRTRSIIGAQLLINAGLENTILALENGTMGWHLAGFPLEHGQCRRPPTVSDQGLAWARAAAARMVERFGVEYVDHATLARWSAGADRTLYLFDVRQPEEYAAGHLPGARHVAGGQLVQETDRYIAVRNARIVLCDDTGVRAVAAAAWLRQMGFSDVHVLRDPLAGRPLETGPWRPRILGAQEPASGEIHAEALLDGRLREFTVIDLAASPNYGRGHLPGAHFAIRAQLREALGNVPSSNAIVLTSEDGILARLAAPELRSLSGRIVRPLVGGTQAWCAAGGELERGIERWAVPPQDVWLKPFDQREGKVEDRLNTYLKWETDLRHQVLRDGTLRFAIAPEVASSA